MQVHLDYDKVWKYLGNNRNVDHTKFLRPVEEVRAQQEADRQAAINEQMALQASDVAGKQAVEASKGE